MLRRLGESREQPGASVSDEMAFPALDQAFVLDEKSAGIRFYKGRESFFRPYTLLQGMSFKPEFLTLQFADADISISGRGLHELYCFLSNQRVACVVEQGDRYAKSSEAATFISSISINLK